MDTDNQPTMKYCRVIPDRGLTTIEAVCRKCGNPTGERFKLGRKAFDSWCETDECRTSGLMPWFGYLPDRKRVLLRIVACNINDIPIPDHIRPLCDGCRNKKTPGQQPQPGGHKRRGGSGNRRGQATKKQGPRTKKPGSGPESAPKVVRPEDVRVKRAGAV